MAGPLRSALVAKLGERYFFGIFSLLSIAGLVWFAVAYRVAPFVPLGPTIPAMGWLVFVLVFLGFLLVVLGSGPRNPTDTRGPQMVDSKLPVYGITRVTRHPRLCGVSLWAIAHLLVNGQLAAFLMFGSLLVTTVNGMVSIDRKRRRALGALWDQFEKQTSRLPSGAHRKQAHREQAHRILRFTSDERNRRTRQFIVEGRRLRSRRPFAWGMFGLNSGPD